MAIVHNGIIENHEALRADLKGLGYTFTSETDTEVVAHRIHHHLNASADLFEAVRKTVAELQGAYAIAAVCEADPECIVVAREGCPVVIGLGIHENFVASDVAALLPVTRRFMFLEEGDVAEIRRKSVKIVDKAGTHAQRAMRESELPADAVERGQYRHHHALFLGRGPLHSIAMEGALKLKEISYIHAEAYAAAELKHGPVALIDEDMPVVAVAPNNELLEKLKSNLQEVRARGGKLFVFANPQAHFHSEEGVTVIEMPAPSTALQASIVFAIPMQLLAYHVAVLKGTDVDQPRNLAKSLTVE